MLWAPYATSNGQWIANKVIQGIFGAPIESLCEISIADVYFTHERGKNVALYALFLAGSNFVAPVISGFINDGQGWQWVLHWCAIFNGIAFVIVFLFMEETNYRRKAQVVGAGVEHHSGPGQGPEDTSEENAMKVQSAENTDITPRSNYFSSKKSYLEKLKLLRRQDLQSSVPLTNMIMRPFLYFSFPAVAFSGFMYGAVVCYFNVLNATASLILSGHPYNFSSSIVGLSYVSCLIGVLIGTYFSGPLGDKFVLWKARRNNGIMEPEYRLWLYTALIIVIPASMILWGVGAAHQIHWVGLMFAMGGLGASLTIGCQLPISYCIDCYRDLGADAIVTVILIRNTMSFAVSYGVTPWVTNMGYQNAFLVAAFSTLAQQSLFLVFIRWGHSMPLEEQARRNGLRGYASANLQPWIVQVIASVTALAVVAVALRLLSRRLKQQQLWWDDKMIVFSLCWYLVIVGFCFGMYSAGLGLHADETNQRDIVILIKWLVAAEVLYVWNLAWTKTSILLMYYRIFHVTSFKRVAWIVGTFVWLWVVTITFLSIFICLPVQKLWYPELSGRCINQFATWISNAVSTILTDLMILVMPLPQIWRLQLKRMEKVALTVAFGLGLL
ncbi:hypothetical protein O9K51_09336 [Purpureocillium lavendulum]|uniref:Rhodopsin domain-containing protein n=1 Tax=Purpureocillium lavendulum TaxID=1247861 RepID=A0AB34FGU7_9HYPO|nr:hypothetical protein O9K51_09336 [Purpureocillium lavendulum]